MKTIKKITTIILSIIFTASLLPLGSMQGFAEPTTQIRNVSINSPFLYEGVDGYYASEGQEKEYFKYFYKINMQITFDDYSVINVTSINEKDYRQPFEYQGNFYDIEWNDGQSYDNQWIAGNSYEVSYSVMGYEGTFYVYVNPNQYNSLSISGTKDLTLTFSGDNFETTEKIINYQGSCFETNTGKIYKPIITCATTELGMKKYDEDLVIQIGNLISNSLDGCKWLRVASMYSTLLFAPNLSNGTMESINENNLLAIISYSVWVCREDFWRFVSGETITINELSYRQIDESIARECIEYLFGTSDFNLTKVEGYDSVNKKVPLSDYGFGGNPLFLSFEFINNIYHCRFNTPLGGSIHVLLDDNGYFIGYYDQNNLPEQYAYLLSPASKEVKSVSIDDIHLTKGIDSYTSSRYDSETGSYMDYDCYYMDSINLTVEYTDGTKERGFQYSIKYSSVVNGDYYAMQENNPWNVGDVILCPITVNEDTYYFNVYIEDNPIISIEATEPIILIKNVDGQMLHYGQEQFFMYQLYNFTNDITVKVKYKEDGIEKIGNFKGLELNSKFGTNLDIDDNQYSEHWTETGKMYSATITLAGKTAPINVKLIETEKSFYDWEAMADAIINEVAPNGVWNINAVEPKNLDIGMGTYAYAVFFASIIPSTEDIHFGSSSINQNKININAYRKYGNGSQATIKQYELILQYAENNAQFEEKGQEMLALIKELETGFLGAVGSEKAINLEDVELIHEIMNGNVNGNGSYASVEPSNILFSKNVRTKVNAYKNYSIKSAPISGKGGHGFAYNDLLIAADFNGIFYAYDLVGCANHSNIYIFDDTEDSVDAYIKAAQKRIDDAFGRNRVKIERAGEYSFLPYIINILDDDGNVIRSSEAQIIKDSSKVVEYSGSVHEYDDSWHCILCGVEARPEEMLIRGDVNNDGVIDAADVTALARHIANLSIITDKDILVYCCDTDGDGDVDAADVTHLARYIANLISEL